VETKHLIEAGEKMRLNRTPEEIFMTILILKTLTFWKMSSEEATTQAELTTDDSCPILIRMTRQSKDSEAAATS
jgi:hypothetical protein